MTAFLCRVGLHRWVFTGVKACGFGLDLIHADTYVCLRCRKNKVRWL